MKIRVVSSREEIPTLNPNEKVIHLAFRQSNRDVFMLAETCPKIEAIQLPKSYRRTVSKSIEMFLEMQKIDLVEGDVWGHRTDINEYYNVSQNVLEKIHELKAERFTNEAIAEKLSRESKLNSDMILYILSKRSIE
ncbi:MAG: DUF1699 family protein [Alphaproteobacteria bacterium]|nr:MAG: DUF1699 family protein [Alphaproteobacteria bacterium]